MNDGILVDMSAQPHNSFKCQALRNKQSDQIATRERRPCNNKMVIVNNKCTQTQYLVRTYGKHQNEDRLQQPEVFWYTVFGWISVGIGRGHQKTAIQVVVVRSVERPQTMLLAADVDPP